MRPVLRTVASRWTPVSIISDVSAPFQRRHPVHETNAAGACVKYRCELLVCDLIMVERACLIEGY